MKKILIILSLLVLFGMSSYAQSYRQNSVIATYNQVLKGKISTVINDSLVANGLNGNVLSVSKIQPATLGGSLTATDSTTSVILKDSAGKKWKLRIYTNGAVVADSTGLN